VKYFGYKFKLKLKQASFDSNRYFEHSNFEDN